jgi:hypothetical protein
MRFGPRIPAAHVPGRVEQEDRIVLHAVDEQAERSARLHDRAPRQFLNGGVDTIEPTAPMTGAEGFFPLCGSRAPLQHRFMRQPGTNVTLETQRRGRACHVSHGSHPAGWCLSPGQRADCERRTLVVASQVAVLSLDHERCNPESGGAYNVPSPCPSPLPSNAPPGTARVACCGPPRAPANACSPPPACSSQGRRCCSRPRAAEGAGGAGPTLAPALATAPLPARGAVQHGRARGCRAERSATDPERAGRECRGGGGCPPSDTAALGQSRRQAWASPARFAVHYLASHPGVSVGFIPAAVGGSPISSWAARRVLRRDQKPPLR